MDNPHIVIADIGETEVPVIVNPKECYSIITTELLEILNMKCNNVKFTREQIVLSGRHVNVIGKIMRFNFSLQFISLHHDVYIVNDETPLLLLGQDWIDRHNIQYSLTCAHLYIQGKFCVPVYQLGEEFEHDQIKSKEIELTIREENMNKSDETNITNNDDITQEATRHLENVSEIFNTQADHNQLLQKKRNSKSKNNHIKCYICKQKGHTMKSCIFESEFRKHEDYCRHRNIHKWKSWNHMNYVHLKH